MRGLTLTQPWACLVAIDAKRIETRDWATTYRGRIAIHAAKKFPADARCLCPLPPFGDALGSEILHTGQIVAIATLAECFRFDATTEGKIRKRSSAGLLPPHEADFGDYTAGRFGFVLQDVQRVTPVACRGMLGLWNVPPELSEQITAVAPPGAGSGESR